MTPRTFTIAAAMAAALSASAIPAQAQSSRTFVSGLGTDAGTCGATAPCRSFAYAITQTNAGGEIAVLNTAGYGTVTITKAISIINEEGSEAAITVSSGDGITINAGPSDVVNLRGLTVVGGGGLNGITFKTGGVLNVQNCVIRGFSIGTGINLVPTVSADFNLSDTIVSNNGADGIILDPSGTGLAITASFERVQAIGNALAGFYIFADNATGTIIATASDSLAAHNAGGFGVQSNNAAAVMTVTNSKAVNNQFGVSSQASAATMFLTGSTISGNSTDGYFADAGGVIKSFGNNSITDTTNNGALTPVSVK